MVPHVKMPNSFLPDNPHAVALAFAAASFVYLLTRIFLSKKGGFPPGPRRWPVLGSALSVPRAYQWLTFSKWAKIYGNVIYLDVVGQPIIVLNSAKVAKDLLDQRSSIYSDRPDLPYGENWRQQRKVVAQDFSQSAMPRYYALQESEAKKLVRSVLDDPRTLARQIKLRLGTIIIRVTYGHYITGEQDPFLTSPLTAMHNFSQASAPGTWAVDFLPILHAAVDAGGKFLKTADEWRDIVWNTSWEPYLWAKDNIASGNALLPNMCATTLEAVDGKPTKEQEESLVWAASTVMGAGMDTNASTVLVFFLAMMLHPDVQAKARREIDDVVGRDRLPTIQDRASLPYIRSIMTEVFRWNPAVPLTGIAHALSQDDVYEGMHVPKGALIIPNVWHMFHDPTAYPNPMEFNPDRYNNLDAEMDKVADVMFGFGRRVCPGKVFAEGTFFAIVATVLATCEILPVVDAQGNKVVPEVTFSSGTIIFPSAFDIDLKARSEKALDLLSRDY
ncbi:putative monooxygenase [Mycena sp. CBHHK59/15]|nr:putative monooxygenase [Mycena sp. CBHHK59/15]